MTSPQPDLVRARTLLLQCSLFYSEYQRARGRAPDVFNGFGPNCWSRSVIS
jgi:hypothetical protein